MTRKLRLFAAMICLLVPSGALALDAAPAVTVTPLLKATHSWDGTPLAYPEGTAEVTGLLIEMAPGAETGWHLHPVPSFGMVLEGTLEVTLNDGRVTRVQAGEALAEVVNTPHNGRTIGGTPVKLIVFYAGAAGQQLTVRMP